MISVSCRAEGLEGFCTRLSSDLVEIAGMRLREGAAEEGDIVIDVTVKPRGPYSASADMAVGRWTGGRMADVARSDLRISSRDKTMDARSAGALVKPLADMVAAAEK